MKLVLKLLLALVAAISTVLAVNGYFRIRREVGLFDTLAVCEPATLRETYVHHTVVETILTTLVLASACALVSGILGVTMVGRPVRLLIAKARRIGAGDFAELLHLRAEDELGELAKEMNRTCERLVEAAARVEAETASRIAAIEQLRHADRLMTVGKLASGLAHELGTPLNVVEARAEMIASGETTVDESRDYANVIIEASQRMARILRQLLDFARARRAEKAPCDVLELAEKTARRLEPLAAKRGVSLAVKGEPAHAVVDAAQIEQVVANVVVNAVQATRREGKVDVDVRPSDGRVRIVVRDEGDGIAPENLPHIFEPFFTTKDVGEGTGLGLAVAYGIVEEHGGEIEVESAVGKGTTFTIHVERGQA